MGSGQQHQELDIQTIVDKMISDPKFINMVTIPKYNFYANKKVMFFISLGKKEQIFSPFEMTCYVEKAKVHFIIFKPIYIHGHLDTNINFVLPKLLL